MRSDRPRPTTLALLGPAVYNGWRYYKVFSLARWAMSRPRKAAFVSGLFAVAAVVAWPGCGKISDDWDGQPGPPRVLTSFAPVYCFVKNVGGDQVGVLCLCR